jgi:hypothetical protein
MSQTFWVQDMQDAQTSKCITTLASTKCLDLFGLEQVPGPSDNEFVGELLEGSDAIPRTKQ